MTAGGPRVSAIVCVRNGARWIARALASIRAQRRPPDDIVVVDGRSTDGTAAIAAAPDVRIVIQPGTGLADARNAGIAAAAGDLLAFLDHDDRWTPDKLAIQLDLMDATGADHCVGHLRRVRIDGAPVAGPLGAPRLGRTPGTLLATRGAFDRIGGFDPALGMGCDMDWFIRAGDCGPPAAIASEIVLLKSIRADSLSADPAANRRAALAVLAGRRRRQASR
ncbi:MAG: glycosyltransferase family 2 protein [Alphaproteobacteria bacterium]